MSERLGVRSFAFCSWNLLLACVVFAMLWSIPLSALNLWTICALTHVLVTSQAFFLRDRPASGGSATGWLRRFMTFHLASLAFLAINALMVNALVSQSIDPRVAQVLALLLVATSAGLLGAATMFDAERSTAAATAQKPQAAVAELILPISALGISLVLFELIWGSFYDHPGHIGHDFALAGTGLLEGKYWLMNNGVIGGLFNPPWFTAAWCAGTALYADPQSAFYSPLQWFSFVVDPFAATHLGALLYAVVGFAGWHVLARKIGGWTVAGAAVFAVLGVANNFLPLRSAVGEGGYQPWPLWPWLAVALCWPALPGIRGHAWPAVGVAVFLTAWVQFGFGGMLVPGVLAVLLLCSWLTLSGRANPWTIAIRLLSGGLVAIAVNGARIFEGLSFMGQFPRNFYDLPGFPVLRDALAAVGLSLFAPSEWTFRFGLGRLEGMSFTALPHEWAMSFGGGALLMFSVTLLAVWSTRRRALVSPHPSPAVSTVDRGLALGLAFVLLAIPILLLWSGGSARDLIKQIPILNSATWPMRWVVLYLPLVQWLLATPANKLAVGFPKHATMIAAAALVLIWLGPAREPLRYYFDPQLQSYNPGPVRDAFIAATKGEPPIPISRVAGDPQALGLSHRNDTMLMGVSQGFCYNPIYGYRLEAFPQIERLQDGEALSTDDSGQSLLFNPACLVHPLENDCVPGDGFKMSDPAQRLQAERFIARQPFEWRRPLLGQLLAVLSQGMFWLLLALVTLRTWTGFLRLISRTASSSQKTSA